MIILLLAIACTEITVEQKEESRKHTKCVSRSSGSQPECWDEKDWEIFCQKVSCKE